MIRERVGYLLFEYHVLGDQPSVNLVCPVPIGFDLLDHALEHLFQHFLLNILSFECQANVIQDLGSLVLRLLQGGGRQHAHGALEGWLLHLQAARI